MLNIRSESFWLDGEPSVGDLWGGLSTENRARRSTGVETYAHTRSVGQSVAGSAPGGQIQVA